MLVAVLAAAGVLPFAELLSGVVELPEAVRDRSASTAVMSLKRFVTVKV